MKEFLFMYKSEIFTSVISILTTCIVILLIIGKHRYKWFWKEVLNMYSGADSHFSKKRIESGAAFIFAFWMTIFYLKNRISDMDIWSFGYVLTVWLFIAGYTVQQIEREKKIINGNGKTENSEEKKEKPTEI